MAWRQGEQVTLRPIEPEDYEIGYSWMNDPEVTRYLTAGVFPLSKMTEREWYEAQATAAESPESGFNVAIEDEGGRCIGTIGFHEVDFRHGRASMGIVIGEKEAWGQGYGTDAIRTLVAFAFEEMRLHKVELDVIEENQAAIRCYEKAGFSREGLHRDHVFTDGTYHNMVRMSLLADDWRAAGDGEGE